jgi:hypothetical protein
LIVEEVKNLPKDGYRAILNIGPLGGEGVPFYVIVFCSIIERNNWEWEIREHSIEGLMFCSSLTGHKSQVTP